MSTKYKFHDQEQLYFVTFAVVGWIDLFIRKEYKDVLLYGMIDIKMVEAITV